MNCSTADWLIIFIFTQDIFVWCKCHIPSIVWPLNVTLQFLMIHKFFSMKKCIIANVIVFFISLIVQPPGATLLQWRHQPVLLIKKDVWFFAKITSLYAISNDDSEQYLDFQMLPIAYSCDCVSQVSGLDISWKKTTWCGY